MSADRRGVAVGRSWALVALTAAAASCAQVLGFERSEPSTSPEGGVPPEDGSPGDAGATDADGPDPFACATATLPIVDPTRPLTFRAGLLDVETSRPVTDVWARTCARADLVCANPKEGPDGGVRPTPDGFLVGSVDYGFNGYFEITGPRYLPALLFVNPPPVKDVTGPQVPLLAPALFDLLASASTHVSNAVDPTLGHVVVHIEDCLGAGRAGVRVSTKNPVKNKTLFFYLYDLLPAPNATETDKSGNAGVLNLAPGLVTVDATFSDGRTFGSVTFGVRAGALSYLSLVPKW